MAKDEFNAQDLLAQSVAALKNFDDAHMAEQTAFAMKDLDDLRQFIEQNLQKIDINLANTWLTTQRAELSILHLESLVDPLKVQFWLSIPLVFVGATISALLVGYI